MRAKGRMQRGGKGKHYYDRSDATAAVGLSRSLVKLADRAESRSGHGNNDFIVERGGGEELNHLPASLLSRRLTSGCSRRSVAVKTEEGRNSHGGSRVDLLLLAELACRG